MRECSAAASTWVREALNQRQSDGEYCAAAVRSIVGHGRAAVKFSHQPHDVQAETKVRLVVAVLALLEQRLEQAPVERLRNGGAVVQHLQRVVAHRPFEA